MPTPVKINKLRQLLDGYDDKEYIINGFTYGFHLNFEGVDSSLTSENSLSANTNPLVVSNKSQHELNKGRIEGPFTDPPFPYFKSSPLALREKRDTGKYRLLHNLSFPYDDRSLNFNIPKHASKVSYETITDAIHLLQFCAPKAFMAKSDISDAFRLILLHPSQYHLTGFYWNGFYYDKCLPQGCSSSCKIFERFSSAIKWILENKFNVDYVVKMIDDFLFVAKTKANCLQYLHSFQTLCEVIGVPLAPHKTIGPRNVMIFLGIELDSVEMMASLTVEKIVRYIDTIQSMLLCNKVTLRQLKSVIGMLSFATSIVKSGRPFLRQLHDLAMKANKPHHYLRITNDVKDDLNMWINFLQNFNGKTIIKQPTIASSEYLHLFSDASKIGFGATYGTHWIHGIWPPIWQQQDITVLELYPIFVIISIFAVHLKNAHVIFHCDNMAIVTIINKQTSKHRIIMNILRPFVLILLQHNINFRAEHIPGIANVLCDKISRQQVTAALLRMQGMKQNPTKIPEQLLPENFKLL